MRMANVEMEVQAGERTSDGIKPVNHPALADVAEFHRWHCMACGASGPWIRLREAVKPSNHTRCPAPR